MDFSVEQQAIIDSTAPFIVVDAPAGSGKTEVLSARVAHHLDDTSIPGAKVLAVSYTTRAAREIKDRVRLAVGSAADRVSTGTIHAYCHDLLTYQGTHVKLPIGFEVLSEDVDRIACLIEYCHNNGFQEPTDPTAFLRHADLQRMKQQPDENVELWRAALDQRGAVDFAGMIEKTVQLLGGAWQRQQQRNLYPHIIVDEAQNLTPLQYHLLTLLAGTRDEPGASLALFGDKRQGIVGFAGADPALLDSFKADYEAAEFRLTLNYRSAHAIQALLSRISEGIKLDHRTVDSAARGQVVATGTIDEHDEASKVVLRVNAYLNEGLDPELLAPGENNTMKPEDIAILGRSAASLSATKQALDQAGIPVAYGAHAKDWLESLEGQCLRALIARQAHPTHQSTRRLLQDLAEKTESAQSAEAQRILEMAKTDPPSLTVLDDLLKSLAQSTSSAISKDAATISEALQQYRLETPTTERNPVSLDTWLTRHASARELPPGVRVLTVHKAQGHQFKAVHIVGLVDGVFPNYYARTNEQKLDEQRIFYVACSRASRRLGMSWPAVRHTQHGKWATEPSPYLHFAQDL